VWREAGAAAVDHSVAFVEVRPIFEAHSIFCTPEFIPRAALIGM
jgi:hypothetical protein